MSEYSIGRQEQLFVAPESGYGQAGTPASGSAVSHLTCTLAFTRERADRTDRGPTRGTAQRVTRRRKGEWSVEGYLIPSGAPAQEPDVADLIKAMCFGDAQITQAATVGASPEPTASVFAISPADAVAAGQFVRVGSEVRPVTENDGGTLTVDPPLSSAPSAGDPVGVTVNYRLQTENDGSFTLWRFGTHEAQALTGCVGDRMTLSLSGGEEARIAFHGPARDEIIAGTDALDGLISDKGFSQSGANPETDLSGGSDNAFKISVDGAAAVTVTLNQAACTTGENTAAEMQSKIQAEGGVLAGVTATYNGSPPTDYYLVRGSTTQQDSSVTIIDADSNSCAAALKLGTVNGGRELCFGQIQAVQARKFSAGPVIAVDQERMKVLSTDADTGICEVDRAYDGTDAAPHDDGAEVRPHSPDPETFGSPVPGILGGFFIDDRAVPILETSMELAENVGTLDGLYGSDASQGFVYPARRKVSLKAKVLLTTDTWSLYGKARTFETMSVLLQSGRDAGSVFAVYLPRVEWTLPQVSLPPDGEVVVELSGAALETEGNDELYLAFA